MTSEDLKVCPGSNCGRLILKEVQFCCSACNPIVVANYGLNPDVHSRACDSRDERRGRREVETK